MRWSSTRPSSITSPTSTSGMGKKKSVLLAAIALAVLLAGLLLSFRGSRVSASTPAAAAPGDGVSSGRVLDRAPEAGMDGMDGMDPDAMVAYLRSRYGAQIQHPYVQIKMLERLIRYFRARSPDRWQAALLDLV